MLRLGHICDGCRLGGCQATYGCPWDPSRRACTISPRGAGGGGWPEEGSDLCFRVVLLKQHRGNFGKQGVLERLSGTVGCLSTPWG